MEKDDGKRNRKMRIGILTYHRSQNYGALLQAVALRHVLAGMGHEVWFVDYWPEYHREMYALLSIRMIWRKVRKGHPGYARDVVMYWRRRKERIENFGKFIRENIEPYVKGYGDGTVFDAVVYGSDQIWRKQEERGGAFDAVYFGKNKIVRKRDVAYAASMGTIDLGEEDEEFLKERLGKFERITVREASLDAELKRIGLKSEVTVDPTLLMGRKEWDALLKPQGMHGERYVLYYRLLDNTFEEEEVREFAESKGLKLVVLAGKVGKKEKDVTDTAGPEVFVALIRGAEWVVTSSYHGLVFSIIYHKPFIASFNKNAGRAEALLNNLGITGRLTEPRTKREKGLPKNLPEIDYGDVDKRIEKMRRNSMEVLRGL